MEGGRPGGSLRAVRGSGRCRAFESCEGSLQSEGGCAAVMGRDGGVGRTLLAGQMLDGWLRAFAMSPRPIYRWKSFWLGVWVLGFVGWAWWDSMHFQTMLTMDRWGMKLGVLRLEGVTLFTHGVPVDEGFWHDPRPYPVAFVEARLESMVGANSGLGKMSDVAVLLSCLALWGGWLVWHWKREQRRGLP